MAMKVCKDCGTEVSKSAKSCPKCGKKLKHTALRVTLGIIIIIIGICFLAGDTANTQNITQTESSITQKQEKMTLEKFNKIKTGMTYKQVVEIIGEEGTVLSETDLGDSKYKTTIYCWYADNGIANANVTIQGGKVVSKAQAGLK